MCVMSVTENYYLHQEQKQNSKKDLIDTEMRRERRRSMAAQSEKERQRSVDAGRPIMQAGASAALAGRNESAVSD